MKRIIFFILICLTLVACSESIVNKCTRVCSEGGSEYYKTQWKSTCRQLKYYIGEEAVLEQIEECLLN